MWNQALNYAKEIIPTTFPKIEKGFDVLVEWILWGELPCLPQLVSGLDVRPSAVQPLESTKQINFCELPFLLFVVRASGEKLVPFLDSASQITR
jgi:hypothetical protein